MIKSLFPSFLVASCCSPLQIYSLSYKKKGRKIRLLDVCRIMKIQSKRKHYCTRIGLIWTVKTRVSISQGFIAPVSLPLTIPYHNADMDNGLRVFYRTARELNGNYASIPPPLDSKSSRSIYLIVNEFLHTKLLPLFNLFL